MTRKDGCPVGYKKQGKKCLPLFKCMVVRHADTKNMQVGSELLTPTDMIREVDNKIGGTYLSVFRRTGFSDFTPVLIETKKGARTWAKKIDAEINRRKA